MIKKIIIMIVILTFAVLAAAQNRQERNKPDADMVLQHLTESLTLTEAQQANIKPLIEKQIQLMTNLHENRQSQNRSDMQQFREANDKIVSEIKTFLTEEQQTEYDKLREEMHKNRKNGQKNRN
jgi:hypothetical protein